MSLARLIRLAGAPASIEAIASAFFSRLRGEFIFTTEVAARERKQLDSGTYQAGKSSAHSRAPATNSAAARPKDADGDHDGDTAGSDAKGLDVRG